MGDFNKAIEKVIRAIEDAADIVENTPNIAEYLVEVYGDYDNKVWYVYDYIENELKAIY